MDGLHIFLVVLLGVVSHSHGQISGPVLEVTARPGDNITLHCDCKFSTGVYIIWYRKCSHDNQPTLALRLNRDALRVGNGAGILNPLPRFDFVKNISSKSYDLRITNMTDSDVGLYYCGTQEMKVMDEDFITSRTVYRYGNITTRVVFNPDSSPADSCPCHVVPAVSWMTVCAPAFTILSSFLCFVLVYHFCQRTDEELQMHQKRPDATRLTRQYQDGDGFLTRVVFRVKDGQTQQ